MVKLIVERVPLIKIAARARHNPMGRGSRWFDAELSAVPCRRAGGLNPTLNPGGSRAIHRAFPVSDTFPRPLYIVVRAAPCES